MNIVTCPNCEIDHNMCDLSDYWDGMVNNCFSIECICGVEFTIDVEYDPVFTETGKFSFPPWFIGPHKEEVRP